MVLSPEAVVQLWNEVLDDARRNRTGPFGWKNSNCWLESVQGGWDEIFTTKRSTETAMKEALDAYYGERLKP